MPGFISTLTFMAIEAGYLRKLSGKNNLGRYVPALQALPCSLVNVSAYERGGWYILQLVIPNGRLASTK